jgi:hypothetical protein
MGIESELPYAEDEWRYIQEHPFVCRNEQSCRYTIRLGHSINQWHMILFHVLVNYFGKRIWNNYLYFIRLKKESTHVHILYSMLQLYIPLKCLVAKQCSPFAPFSTPLPISLTKLATCGLIFLAISMAKRGSI